MARCRNCKDNTTPVSSARCLKCKEVITEHVTPGPEDYAFAEDLLTRDAVQLSSKYRSVGALPPGTDPLEMLKELDPVEYDYEMERMRRHARDHILRSNEGRQYVQTLTPAQFRAFKEIERRRRH